MLLAWPAQADPALDLVAAARDQVGRTLVYDPRYEKLAYPMGDVPIERGVCTDVVIRAFRSQGIDLQRLVHEDMRKHFQAYPQSWGLKRPDANIDHRRVPNLATYFKRQGLALEPGDYRAGDIVTWMLPGNLPHIGIVSDRADPGSGRPLIIHNIGAGTREEDMLTAYPATGHFRWFLIATTNAN
ncbi:DUF1287 domain-containing protein [Dongia sp.]|uniref:DUF1287 domain-containing protein n=1 Tax=Dongia sp. TaxID=1977262 RepID=UPI0037528B82